MELFQQQLAPSASLKIAGGLLVLVSLPFLHVLGGTQLILLAAATAVSVHVYRAPESVVVAGPLFILAVNVFFPSAARFDPSNTVPAWEMRYWAVGLLLITGAALLRLRSQAWRKLPRSLKFFLIAALAASVFGAARGNDISYVARQLFGSVLLVAYFAFAQHFSNEDNFCQSMRTYALPCVTAFVLYYAWVFPERGLHKELTNLPTQTCILAILFAGQGGRRSRLVSAVMMIPPVLLIERRALAGYFLAVVLIWTLQSTSRLQRWSLTLASAAIVVFSLVPSLGTMLLEKAPGTSALAVWLPDGAYDTSSLQDRAIQLVEAGLILRRSPILGDGMGSELSWLSAARGDMQQAYIDNGWAYVAVKMGLFGVASFAWFLWVILKKVSRNSVALSASLLSMLLLVMFTEPVFFQFTSAPLLGVVCGFLYRKQPLLAV